MKFNGLEKHWKPSLLISFCSIVTFVLCLISSMIYYPDGTSATGYNGFDRYSFWSNFISDLGMTKTFGGIPNPVSSTLLFIGILVLSIGGSIFYLLACSILGNKEEEKDNSTLTAVGSVIGIIGNFFLLGVSLFPKDTELLLHEITSVTFFLLSFIAVLIYNRVIILRKDISNKYTILGYIFVICGLIYAIVPKWIIPQFDDESQFIFKPASQKIAVISLLLAMINYMLLIKKMQSEASRGNAFQ